MPEPSQIPRCASCGGAYNEFRTVCNIRETHCLACCSCVVCGCGKHIKRTKVHEYAVSTLNIPYSAIEVGLKVLYGWKDIRERQIADCYDVDDHRIKWPCKNCFKESWLNKIITNPKMATTDYTEGLEDTTEGNDKRILISGRNAWSTEGRDRPKFTESKPADLYPFDIYVSNEIEACAGGSAELREVVEKYGGSIVRDGSLGDNGYEINTGPTYGENYVTMLDAICAAAQESHGQINTDCGLHVHMDVRNESIETIYRTAYLWAGFEAQFFAMQPKSRRQATRSSWWCKPISTKWRVMQAGKAAPKDQATKLGFLMAGKLLPLEQAIPHVGNGGDRYRAFNLCSYARHKTIEIRLHSGTLLANKIRPWTVICASLLQAGRTMTDDELIKHCSNTEKTAEEKLLDIIATEEARTYLQQRKKQFADLNTPELLAKIFDPATDYRQYISVLNRE